jgi:hypothetical protein
MTARAAGRRHTAAVAVVAVCAGAALGPAGVEAAKKAVSNVLVTNTSSHPVAVKAVGTTPVSGTVAVSGGALDVSGSKVDASGSKVDASGSKVDASGSSVAVSGGKLDVSGSTVNLTAPVGISGAVHVAGETPFQQHGFWILNAGDDAEYTLLTIPAGKKLVVQYMTADVAPVTAGADLPLQISIQDGHGTGGAGVYLPLQKAGTAWQGSELTQVLFDQALVDGYRPTTAGTARVQWEVSGYLVDA